MLRYLTIGCLATTAVIGAMAVLAGDIDLRTIATVLLIGIAAPIAIPMIQRLIDARPMIRIMRSKHIGDEYPMASGRLVFDMGRHGLSRH